MYSDYYHLRIQTLFEQLTTLPNKNLPKTSYSLIHVRSKAPFFEIGKYSNDVSFPVSHAHFLLPIHFSFMLIYVLLSFKL